MEFYESSKVAGMINKLADSSSVYDLEWKDVWILPNKC